MAIRIIPARRVRKVKTQNGQEVLRRLEEYLKCECDVPVEILCGFWQDQQDAITYQEIRQAVMDGTINQETIDLWRQDYSVLVADKLSSMWTDAVAAGPSGQPILDGLVFEYNMQSPGIMSWLREHGAEFVTSCTQEQKDAIAALVTKKMKDNHTVDELARLIRPCIGLTEGQAKANARYYDNIVANLRKEHPRMKPETIRKKALNAVQKYAERQHRERALLIAQTESAFAYNRGAFEGVRQAQSQNLIGTVRKKWSTSGDDQVCAICNSLEGTEIGMDDSFDFKGNVLFVGHKLLPPAHPRCACAVEYIEVSPPVFGQGLFIGSTEDSDTDGPLVFEDGKDAYEFFGKKPDRRLRMSDREEYNRLLDEYKNSQFGKWEAGLEMLEGRAIENYTGMDYSAINGLLRHEMTENQVALWEATSNMTVQDMIDNITSAISKFELKQDIVVYRTCEKDVLESLKPEVGSIFHDDGFGSTSVTWSKKAGGNIRMEITVPKGQGTGAWVNPLNGYEGTDRDEYEFLLNRGTDYEVLGIEQNGDDVIVKMKVIGRTESGWSYATKEEVVEKWKARGIYDEEAAKLL